jgi:hypothetical protein
MPEYCRSVLPDFECLKQLPFNENKAQQPNTQVPFCISVYLVETSIGIKMINGGRVPYGGSDIYGLMSVGIRYLLYKR